MEDQHRTGVPREEVGEVVKQYDQKYLLWYQTRTNTDFISISENAINEPNITYDAIVGLIGKE